MDTQLRVASCGRPRDVGHRCTLNGGQIGPGAPDPASTPLVVAVGADARDVATGAAHTCIVTASGQVSCWGCRPNGTTTFGCLDANSGKATPPELIPGLEKVVEVAAGGLQTCALREDGTVWCFGTNTVGQLGTQVPTGMTMATPTAVPGISDAVHVTASYGATCVLRATGAVTCFGRNTSGECGNGAVTASSPPGPVVGITDARDMGEGFLNACVLLAGGDIRCWGRDTDGETTGVPPSSAQNRPTPVPFAP